MRPILLPWNSVNHRAPSGPASITMGTAAGVGTRYSVIAPPRVMRPILLPACSVNQRAPSGPTVILPGRLLGLGRGYSVMAPAVVILSWSAVGPGRSSGWSGDGAKSIPATTRNGD